MFCNVSGIKLPKKSAAETGQNESAKRMPRDKAPIVPLFFNLVVVFSDRENPGKENDIIPSRKNPVRIKTGPNILGIIFCINCDACGIFKSDALIRIPRTTYAIIRPRVYISPVVRTEDDFSTPLTIYDTAAIFEASGQGLMDVKIPNQHAEIMGMA